MKRPHTTLTLAVTWVCSLILSSCAETPPEPPPPSAPQAPTLTVTQSAAVFADSVIFQGTVNPNGQLTTAYFAYDTLALYRYSTLPENLGAGALPCTVRAVVQSLWGGREHYWRLYAQNAAGTSWLDGNAFVYRPWPPDIGACAGTSDTTGVAVLTGTINPNGLQTAYHFEYDTTTQYRWRTGEESAGIAKSWVNVQVRVADLLHRTRYFYRLVASSTAGTSSKEGTPLTTRGFLSQRSFNFPCAIGNTWIYRFASEKATSYPFQSGIHTWKVVGQEPGGWRFMVVLNDTAPSGAGTVYLFDSLYFTVTVRPDSILAPFPEWRGKSWSSATRIPRLFVNDSDSLEVHSSAPVSTWPYDDNALYQSGIGLLRYDSYSGGMLDRTSSELVLMSYFLE